MKKLVIATAIACLGASTAFAGAPAVKLKTETRVGGKSKPSVRDAAPVSTPRTNVGKVATPGTKAANDDLFSQAGKPQVAELLGSTCKSAGSLNSAQNATLALAEAAGTSGTKCITDKFEGDATVQQTAVKMVGAGYEAFKSLGLKDINGDGKITVADIQNDSQRGVIVYAEAKSLAPDLKMNDAKDAIDNLEGTVEANCDILSKEVGTKGAFAAARNM